MTQQETQAQYVICVRNDGNASSLEVRKIYRVIPDEQAKQHQLLHIIDESGEDYLYPAEYFFPIDLPPALHNVFSQAA